MLATGVTAGAAHAGPNGVNPDQPVAAGTYTYATSGRFGYGETDSYPATTRIRFDPLRAGVQHWHWDQRDALGNGTVDDVGVSYQADGVHLVYSNESYTDPTGTSAYDCRPTQPQLIVPARPRTGERISYTLPCTGYTQSYVITVMAPQSISVGGQTVKALVLREQTSWAGGGYDGEGTTYYWLLPGSDLVLKEVASYGEHAYGVPYYSQSETARLTGLHPQ